VLPTQFVHDNQFIYQIDQRSSPLQKSDRIQQKITNYEETGIFIIYMSGNFFNLIWLYIEENCFSFDESQK